MFGDNGFSNKKMEQEEVAIPGFEKTKKIRKECHLEMFDLGVVDAANRVEQLLTRAANEPDHIALWEKEGKFMEKSGTYMIVIGWTEFFKDKDGVEDGQ